jgi:hypothetical protein
VQNSTLGFNVPSSKSIRTELELDHFDIFYSSSMTMKYLPVLLTLCSTAVGLVARDASEGGIGLMAEHTGPEFDRSDSVVGSNIQDQANANPDEIFGLAVCPTDYPYYCANGNFCCPGGSPWCCVVGTAKFCCPSGYSYCGRDLRCYSS